MFTHVPVIGIGAIIAFLLVGMFRGSREIEWASLEMFVALAVLSIVVYLTGSPANHQMRDLPGISREVIHRHSTAADFAFWSLEALGALSLTALFRFRSTAAVPVRIVAVLLALAFVVLLLMIWTANLGGKIRHPEIGVASSPLRSWIARGSKDRANVSCRGLVPSIFRVHESTDGLLSPGPLG